VRGRHFFGNLGQPGLDLGQRQYGHRPES
jgi:hypothetical protein